MWKTIVTLVLVLAVPVFAAAPVPAPAPATAPASYDAAAVSAALERLNQKNEKSDAAELERLRAENAQLKQEVERLRAIAGQRAAENATFRPQMAGYRYMNATASDDEVKDIALREYADDFSMQKFVYDQQVAAKRYMADVTDREVKGIALREYPKDFSMQKFV